MTRMARWQPATIDEVKRIVIEDEGACSIDELEAFRRYAVDPYFASINRYGNSEHVVVVARKSEEVMYWEDVEEGFNISSTDATGAILEHYCNQDELAIAIRRWMPARTSH